MAAKTNISTYEFKKILENFNLGSLIESKPINSGTVQTNYLLITTECKLVFRYYENRSLNSVRFEADLINYLKDNNYPCPALFKDEQGQFVGVYNGKPYAIFEFVEGVHIDKPNENQRNQLIQKVAELNNLTKDYRSPYEKYRLNYNVDTCRKLAEEVSQKINTYNSREKLKWYKDQLDRLVLPESLTKGVCHSDFHFTNVLYKDDQFNALIDFDDANYTFLTFDLVCLLEPFKASFEWNTWSDFGINDDVFDLTYAKRIVSEYLKHRSLDDLEKKHLFDVYKLSVLIDCIWYFERGDVKDFYEKRKIDYLDGLGREIFYETLFCKD